MTKRHLAIKRIVEAEIPAEHLWRSQKSFREYKKLGGGSEYENYWSYMGSMIEEKFIKEELAKLDFSDLPF